MIPSSRSGIPRLPLPGVRLNLLSISRITFISAPVARTCYIIGLVIASLVGGITIARLRLMSQRWNICIIGANTCWRRRTLSRYRNWLGVIATRPWTIHLTRGWSRHVVWAGLS